MLHRAEKTTNQNAPNGGKKSRRYEIKLASKTNKLTKNAIKAKSLFFRGIEEFRTNKRGNT